MFVFLKVNHVYICQCTARCEPIPVEDCRDLLPYNQTFYPASPAADREEAMGIFAQYDQRLTNCEALPAYTMLCATLFPPCPYGGDNTMLCQGLCGQATNECAPLNDLGVNCDDLPAGNVGDTFCSMNDGGKWK